MVEQFPRFPRLETRVFLLIYPRKREEKRGKAQSQAVFDAEQKWLKLSLPWALKRRAVCRAPLICRLFPRRILNLSALGSLLGLISARPTSALYLSCLIHPLTPRFLLAQQTRPATEFSESQRVSAKFCKFSRNFASRNSNVIALCNQTRFMPKFTLHWSLDTKRSLLS